MSERLPNEDGRGMNDYDQQPQHNERDERASYSETSAPGELQPDEETERKGGAIRGFAAMDREKQKRIASEGGRAAHRQGVAHEWSKDEARAAGRKGGQTVSRNREYMSEIGRRGGQNSGLRRQQGASSE